MSSTRMFVGNRIKHNWLKRISLLFFCLLQLVRLLLLLLFTLVIQMFIVYFAFVAYARVCVYGVLIQLM